MFTGQPNAHARVRACVCVCVVTAWLLIKLQVGLNAPVRAKGNTHVSEPACGCDKPEARLTRRVQTTGPKWAEGLRPQQLHFPPPPHLSSSYTHTSPTPQFSLHPLLLCCL